MTERALWEDWLEYFLNGVVRISHDSLMRAKKIDRTLSECRNRLPGGASKTAMSLADLLAENPLWTVGRVAQHLGVAYTTAQLAVEKLEPLGIPGQVGAAKRDRACCAKEIMNILDEPPRLVG